MKLTVRLTRLEKAAPKPDPRMGHAPEWFADQVLAFLRHVYAAAGLDPDAVQLHAAEKTSRPALRALLTNGVYHFRQAKGRGWTPEEFAAWWPKRGRA